MFENAKEENVIEQTLNSSDNDDLNVSDQSSPITVTNTNNNTSNYLSPNLFDDVKTVKQEELNSDKTNSEVVQEKLR